MSFDYLAHTIASVQGQIDALAEKEAGQTRDRQAREHTEQLRRRLLQDADPSLLFHYLAATKATAKDALRTAWQGGALDVDALAPLKRWQLDGFLEACWLNADPDPAPLGPHAFSLRFTFCLAQPYFSRDENALYIVDNPIARDRTFGLPIVRPSGWKGNLRAALRNLGYDDGDPTVSRLFGKRVDESGQAGRLIFLPTFFTCTGLEIINPHDRATRVGTAPILFETVPPGAEGT
ncbi:MAG: RAMP superfamily CRISPR-associated protein, partial [Anaerolineae bacterium]|nr:RAMP superfamily CRISPR-associated protein [Anaerolineae bacterium]